MRKSQKRIRPTAIWNSKDKNRTSQRSFPRAALTESRPAGYHGGTRPAKSRAFSLKSRAFSVYPQATLKKSYAPLTTDKGKTITPQHYDTVAVELAPGLNYPKFRIPSADNIGESASPPLEALPDPTSGGTTVNAPSQGAKSTETNHMETAKEKQTGKDPVEFDERLLLR